MNRTVKIIITNIVIVLGVCVAIIGYVQGQQIRFSRSERQAFVQNTDAIEGVASNFLEDAQAVVDSWGNHINAGTWTMEEAVEHTRSSMVSERNGLHLIWKDTLCGLSTVASVTDGENYHVDYSNIESVKESLAGMSGIHITPRYTDPMTGTSVVAFGHEVWLLDDAGRQKEAILLRVVPISYIESRWQFPLRYEDADVALIEKNGAYVVKPSSMKQNNFYHYIYSYNQDVNHQELLENKIREEENGTFIAVNAKGEECFWAYEHLKNNPDWIMITTIPTSVLDTHVIDWGLPFIILIALLILGIIDAFYFVSVTKRERLDNEKIKIQAELLKNALAQAEYANSSKTTFLNNMSHDIRTPMNAIVGFTALAAKHIDNRQQVLDYLGKINVSSEHLLSLINDVLDMSRIESGKVKIEEKEVHLPDVLHDLRTIVQANINAKQLELYIDTVDVVNEDIIADKLRLNQIMLNIVSNAIKFTKPGGMVNIRVIQKDNAPEGYGNFQFRIKDTGIGMSKEFQEHIFEAFTREETSTVSGIQGTGLGMAITKNIVDMMGGTIEVNSEEGKGTEFVVSLQFRLCGGVVKSEAIPELKGLRALVVDDDLNTCASVSKMLDSIGMRPEWTTSGKEAVFRTQLSVDSNDEFSAYIIDWLMPDMNGIEVVRRVRRIVGESKPIIILTAYDWADIEEEALEAGVTAFCSKPLFMSELRDILTRSYRTEVVKEEAAVSEFSGEKILLVEDNELNQEIALEILSEAGFVVDVAGDGRVALEKIKASVPGQYDLILMDVQMPFMDGYETTRQIRKLQRKDLAELPIIAMTANAFEEDKKNALEAGMDSYLTKPIVVEELMRKISEILLKG